MRSTLAVVVATAGAWLNLAAQSPSLAKPIPLTAAGLPLNADGAWNLPSPTLFDVDGDGGLEIVVGTLHGDLFVVDDVRIEGVRDPLWGDVRPLVGASGEPVTVPNS